VSWSFDAHFENELLLAHELFARPLGQKTKFSSHEADFAGSAPYNGWRAGKRYQFVVFLSTEPAYYAAPLVRVVMHTHDECALEAALDKHFVFLAQGHLKSYQAWAEDSYGADDAEDVRLLEASVDNRVSCVSPPSIFFSKTQTYDSLRWRMR
jgi:hypothetical protein